MFIKTAEQNATFFLYATSTPQILIGSLLKVSARTTNFEKSSCNFFVFAIIPDFTAVESEVNLKGQLLTLFIFPLCPVHNGIEVMQAKLIVPNSHDKRKRNGTIAISSYTTDIVRRDRCRIIPALIHKSLKPAVKDNAGEAGELARSC